MKIPRIMLASVVTLLAACLTQAADTKPIPYVMSIVDVETEDPSGYATWIAQYNAVAKAKLGIDNYLRVFESGFDGRTTARVRAVASAKSVAELTKNALTLENDPAIVMNRDHLRAIRKTSSRVLFQAVRREGGYTGSHNYTALVVVTDEAAYLNALDQLRVILDGAGLKDAKLNAYRVLAGRTDHSHRVTVNTPSPERLAAFLDVMATNAQVATWMADSSKLRTLVASLTAREITK